MTTELVPSRRLCGTGCAGRAIWDRSVAVPEASESVSLYFVPNCYLRPFTHGDAGFAINLYDIDRRKFIDYAPVKNQCSGDYFYGEDSILEKAIQSTEGAYGTALREIMKPGYTLTDDHRDLLKMFWLQQHLRTEAAIRRAIEMMDLTRIVSGVNDTRFRIETRKAVQIAMETFTESTDIVADLKL